VIGISTFVFTKGQNLNFGVPINYLKAILQGDKVTPLAEFTAAHAHETGGSARPTAPHHDLSLLAGCSDADLSLVGKTITDAIDVGAPLYNNDNHEACFRVYEGAVLGLEKKLNHCQGPRKALLAGTEAASKETDFTKKAWAMRDAFDGVLEVLSKNAAKAGKTEAAPRGPRREVPHHAVTLLRGCSDATLELITKAIADAIEAGASIYNRGSAEGCFRVYEGRSQDLLRDLAQCAGPKQALEDGLKRASKQETFEAKAWAMRDMFDGLLEVIARKRNGGE
jgi:hypothetical protein